MKKLTWVTVTMVAAVLGFAHGVGAFTLEVVKERGELNCGVSIGSAGFSNPDDKGNWQGLNVDICRAVAAAVLGEGAKVRYVALTEQNRLTALQAGKVDLLSMNIPWTMTLDTSLALHFAGVSFFDGQGFLASRKLNVGSALELAGASVCAVEGSTEKDKLVSYFLEHGIDHKSIDFTTAEESLGGLQEGRCNVLSGRQSELYGLLLELEKPEDFLVLPELISGEPMGPIVRQGDDTWFNIVRWTLFTMINAETLAVTSENVEQLRADPTPEISRLLGLDGIKGKGMGLPDEWGYQVIKQVGNYGQSFERNVGQGSPLKMNRGVNSLWSNGGVLFGPPVR